MQDNITLPFSEIKQNALLGHILINEGFFKIVYKRIKPNWFLSERNSKIYSEFIAYYEKYSSFPSIIEFKNCKFFSSIELKEKIILHAFIDRAIVETQQISLEALRPDLTEWLHSTILFSSMYKAQDAYNRKEIKTCHDLLMAGVKEVATTNFDKGTEFSFEDYRDYLKDAEGQRSEALTTGLTVLDKALLKDTVSGGLLKGDTTIVMAPVNVGKCWRENTPIIMADGTIKMVQDIKVGEQLMGPDGKPRNVLSTTTGKGPLFEITPKAGGDKWVCNDVHVLSLKSGWANKSKKTLADGTKKQYCNMDKGEIVNIPLNEFLQKSKYYQSRMHLWRASLDFEEKSLPVDPYILGLWLGDGHSAKAALTTMDPEIKEVWCNWVLANGDDLTVYNEDEVASVYAATNSGQHVKSNAKLRDLDLLLNKHIPHLYLTASRNQRLQLLAGLLDTDGYYSNYNKTSYFEITQKNVTLANNIAFLARSLGFKVCVKEVNKKCQTGVVGKYQRLTIMGRLSEIPTKLDRKKGADGFKDPSTTGFTVKSIGNGDYYGFTLDGDHLLLLGDFTVTHNTTTLITMACHNVKAGKDVLFMTHEGSPHDIRLKILANMADCSISRIFELYKTKEGCTLLDSYIKMLNKHFKYIPYNKAGMTVEEVVPVIRTNQEEKIAINNGKGFDLLVSDYPAILTTDLAKKGTLQKRNIDAVIYGNYVQLALEYGFHALLAIQTNREGSKVNRGISGSHGGKSEPRILGMEDVMESWEPIAMASNVLTLNRSPAAAKKDIMTFGIAKCRSNDTGVAVVAKSNFSHCTSHAERLGGVAYKGTRTNEEQVEEILNMYRNQEIPDSEATLLKLK